MELPIAPQTYQPSAEALVRAIKRAAVMLARTAAEETQLDAATVYCNPQRPTTDLVNFAADVRLEGDAPPSAVLDAVEAHFAAAHSRCFMLGGSEAIWPAPLTAEIEARGYRPDKRSVHLLSAYVRPQRVKGELQIIPGRAAYPQLRGFYQQAARAQHHLDERAAADRAATRIDHLDEERHEVFLGRINGAAAGVVGLVTLGQIGVIDNVYTAPSFRHRGVATTLLAHALDHCQRALFAQVILETEESCSVAALYESFGFKPVAAFVRYIRA